MWGLLAIRIRSNVWAFIDRDLMLAVLILIIGKASTTNGIPISVTGFADLVDYLAAQLCQ
jgi:hypothetical protein